MTEAVFFYLFAGVMLAAALAVVFSRQPVYSVLSLLVAMFCLAALFVMLGAYFIAALQVLLYAGAVLVLFLFVIMLLRLDKDSLARLGPFTHRGLGTVVGALLLFQLLGLLMRAVPSVTISNTPIPSGTVDEIGHALFSTYVLPFELTSFLILAAIIAAVTLAKQHSSK